ncbi:MAG: FlgD immunoglobulin-like domain containing protein, partial [Abditibacteriales bacterium]|nr:FlgD immunoglobulin-like domain containing protein [Abditibacteriales bacterium]
EVDWKVGTGAQQAGWVAGRYSDANNFITARYAYPAGGGELGLYKRVSGNWVQLGAVTLGRMASGSTHRIKLEMNGASLKVYWNGVLRISAVDSFNQGMKKHGILWDAAYDSSSGYDNLLVTTGAGGTSVQSFGLVVSHKQLSPGLHLLSVPVNPGGTKLNPALTGQSNAKLARWVVRDVPHYEVMGEYNNLPLTAMQQGQGYWVYLSNAVTLSVTTDASGDSQSFVIPLSAGWNLIGYPFTTPVPFDPDAIQVREMTSLNYVSLREAAQQGWLDEAFWTYTQDTGYVMVHPSLPQALRELEPWRGYWVHTTRPLELILPSPRNVPTFQRANAPTPGLNEWSLRLVVRGQTGEDACVLGVSRAAGQGEYLAPKPPPPPMPGPAVYLVGGYPSPNPSPSGEGSAGTPRAGVMEAGRRAYAVSLRSAVNGKAVWEVEVNPQGAMQPLTLTMPNLAQLPRSLKVYLLDTETGQRRYMRTVPAYTLNATDKPRRFQIVVEPAGAERKLLSALAATAGGSSRPVLLSFVLGTEANVMMEVVSPTGKLIARSPAPVRRSAGLNTLMWDGKDQRGSVLSRGLYLLRVTATDDEGRTMSLVRLVSLR